MIIEIGEYLMQILQSLLLFWYNNFIQNYGNLIKYVSKYPAHISSPKTIGDQIARNRIQDVHRFVRVTNIP